MGPNWFRFYLALVLKFVLAWFKDPAPATGTGHWHRQPAPATGNWRRQPATGTDQKVYTQLGTARFTRMMHDVITKTAKCFDCDSRSAAFAEHFAT
jgi:hypothetical protein